MRYALTILRDHEVPEWRGCCCGLVWRAIRTRPRLPGPAVREPAVRVPAVRAPAVRGSAVPELGATALVGRTGRVAPAWRHRSGFVALPLGHAFCTAASYIAAPAE